MAGAPPAGGGTFITISDFCDGILTALGDPETANNKMSLVAICQAEGGLSDNNPMNTGLQGKKYGSSFKSKLRFPDYATPNDGIEAVVATLRLTGFGYEAILQNLKTSADPVVTARSWGNSQWNGNQGPAGYIAVALSFKSSGGAAGATYHAAASKQLKGSEHGSISITGAVGGLLNDVPGVSDAKAAAEGVAGLASGIADFVGAITNPHTWWRVGQVVLGLILLILGGVLFAKAAPAMISAPAQKVAKKVKPKKASTQVATA